jgi:CBS domain-containing protein
MSILKLKLTADTSVHEIIQLLDKSGVGMLPIVDDEDHLIGIVTDGDVRRGILHDKLDVDHIINKNPKRLSHRTSKFEILRTLRQMHLRHMPIVDDTNKLIDIVFLENLTVKQQSNYNGWGLRE